MSVSPQRKGNTFMYRDGLRLGFLVMFIFTLLAQALTGWKQPNKEPTDDHSPKIEFETYL